MKRTLEALRYSGAALFFIGAVFLAGMAGLAVYSYLSSAVPTEWVVVAARDLAPGAAIGTGDLTTKQVTPGTAPEGALATVKDGVGRRVKNGLAAGDVVRQQHLISAGTSDVSEKVALLGPDYRAVNLPANLVPAFERLVPGDHLELVGVLPYQDQKVNSAIAMPLGVATVLDVQRGKGQNDEGVVLVALKADEVTKLALTLKQGALTVTVQAEGQPGEPPAALRLDAMTGAAAAAPAAQPAQPVTMTTKR